MKMVDYPEDLVNEALSVLHRVSEVGKVRKGTNEVTKCVERGKAKLILIAEDVSPPEIVRHLPILAKEKRTPYIVVPNAKSLGESCGLEVPTASAAIENAESLASSLSGLVSKINELNK